MSDDTELANAARSCRALQHARLAANWLGDGKEITDTGMPVASDVPDMARALGTTLPEGVSEATDAPDLYRAWFLALNFELITLDSDLRARPVPDPAHADLTDDVLLERWAEALVGTVGAALGIEDDVDATELVELGLDGIAVNEPTTWAQACESVENRFHDEYVDFADDPDDESLKLSRETAETLLAEFAAFGAVNDGFALSALGEWGYEAITAWGQSPQEDMFDQLANMLAGGDLDSSTAALESLLGQSSDDDLSLDDLWPSDGEDVDADGDFGLMDLKAAFELPDSLPPVSLPDIAELAAAARDSALLERVKTLAVWVGQSMPINPAGELSPTDAARAATELGVDSGAETTSGDHEGMEAFPELTQLWSIAETAGLLTLPTPEAYPGPRLGEWPDGDDDAVLSVWSEALYDVLSHGTSIHTGYTAVEDYDLDISDLGIIIGVVLFLDRHSGNTVDELVATAKQTASVTLEPEATEHAWRSLVESSGEPVANLLATLTDLGAVELDGDNVRLTPLGLYAVRNRLEECDVEVPLLPPPEQMSAAELITAVLGADEQQVVDHATAWLSVNAPDAAAEALLAVAASSGPAQRILATAIVKEIEPAPRAPWEAVLDTQSLRPYAKLALASMPGAQPGEETIRGAASAQDMGWLLADSLTATSRPLEDADLEGELDRFDLPVEERAELFDGMWHSGHPYAHEVLTAIGQHHPDNKTAKAARKAAFKASSTGPNS